jgi:membrane fusion protein (multidrug efflux system)
MNGHVSHSRAVATLALLGAAAFSACKQGDAAGAKDSTAAAVATVGPENMVVVSQKQIASGPAVSGALQAEREATVRAEVGGTVMQTFVDQGTRVARGTVLARLNDANVKDAYLSARSGVTAAQSAADVAKRELERNEKLAAAGAIADRELEASRRSNLAAQSQLADAQARLTNAKKQLDDTEVRAPFDGIVAKRQVSAGDFVQVGGALYTVIDPTSMRLEVSVPAAQLDQVKLGAPVAFTVNGYPGRSFSGKVTRISPAADPTTGQIQLVASIPNTTSTLVSGLFADGRVASASHTALTAPVPAVDVRGLKPFVIRVKGGKVEKVDVEVGLRDEQTDEIEILKGLVAGDTLLTGAARGITPGTQIRVNAGTDRPVTKS